MTELYKFIVNGYLEGVGTNGGDDVDAITESSRPGVFFAGSCTGAKTVPETLAEARSAALAIHQYLNKPR